MKIALTLFAAAILSITSCKDDDGIVVEKLKTVYEHGDTLRLNKHLFLRDKMLGDYYINTRDNGDKVIRTRAYQRRAQDHLPLGFDFTHDGDPIGNDSIGHKTAEMLRYVGPR